MTTYTEEGCPTPDNCSDPYHKHSADQPSDPVEEQIEDILDCFSDGVEARNGVGTDYNTNLTYDQAKAKINRLIVEEREKSLGLSDYDGRFDLLTREQQEILLSYHKRSVKELEKLLPGVSNNLSKGDGDE